ncbi:DNA methylase N-4 [Aquicoccus sp. SCR17]|nr:DNA methylase N-4 [Carideicomes alvinocaridis]
MPLDELKPYSRNTRRHSDRQIDLLAKAIQEFGFVNPIVVDDQGVIVAGHGRYAAAQRLKLKIAPVLRVRHLSESQIRAYRIADNRIAELSCWDEEFLRLEIIDLSQLELDGSLGFDLSLTGFGTAELDIIIDSVGDNASEEAPERVEMPEHDALAVCRPGDIWQLGEHRIFCGSALEEASYRHLLKDEVAQMVFTDPPYNVPIAGHVRTGDGGGHREFAMGVGEMSTSEFRAFLGTALGLSRAVVVDGAITMVCMDWRHISDLIEAGRTEELQLLNFCVWNKTNGGMGSLYRSKHELVCIFKQGRAAHVNNVELGRHGRYRTNVWDYAGVNTFGRSRTADLADHPTVKPTALVADAIKDVTHRGDIVLDPFGGSGSTLLAAEKTARRARLIELDPLYVDVAIRRWQKLSGEDAVHVSSGETFAGRAAIGANHRATGEADHGEA